MVFLVLSQSQLSCFSHPSSFSRLILGSKVPGDDSSWTSAKSRTEARSCGAAQLFSRKNICQRSVLAFGSYLVASNWIPPPFPSVSPLLLAGHYGHFRFH